MMVLSVTVDVRKISDYTLDQIPGEIDRIVEPYHLKWFFGNNYMVEDGYDEDLAVRGAIKALESTEWLKDAVNIGFGREVVRRRLDEIDTAGMAAQSQAKVEHYKNYFSDKKISEYDLTYPNVIVLNEKNELVDGYVTYLLMKERGLASAQCLLVPSGTVLKKYVYGVHLPGVNQKRPEKSYAWAYPLREAVVPGDILLANTRCGRKLIKVTQVDVGTAGYVNSLKKIKKFICSEGSVKK